MRGKKPKDREKYFIRLDGNTLVEVNREIYLEWHQSRRKERYQKERDREYGVCSLEGLEEKRNFSGSVAGRAEATEKIALRNIEREKLWEAIGKLPEQDMQLVKLLYFKEITVKKAAEILRCSRKTVKNRNRKALEILNAAMKEEMLT